MFRMNLVRSGNPDEANLNRLVRTVQPEVEAMAFYPPCMLEDTLCALCLALECLDSASNVRSSESEACLPLLVRNAVPFEARALWLSIQIGRFASIFPQASDKGKRGVLTLVTFRCAEESWAILFRETISPFVMASRGPKKRPKRNEARVCDRSRLA